MKIFKNIIFLAFMILLSACSDSIPSDTNTTINENLVDASIINNSAMNINDLTVNVHKNSFDITSKMFNDYNKTLVSLDKMNESFVNTLDKSLKLLNALAQPFKVADDYSSIFSVDNNYTAVSPAFVINATLTNKYFLLSSTTKFFLEGKTIKTYFNDPTSLANAWARVISSADVNKDLFLTLVEIDGSNISRQVSNAFIIEKEVLSAF